MNQPLDAKLINMTALNKKKVIIKIIFGYLLTLSLMLGIVFFSITRLDEIEKTVDDLTNKLAVTRTLSQSIADKIRIVRFNAERYQRFYRQGDLDQFNDDIIELKNDLARITNHVLYSRWVDKIRYIQQETDLYEAQFENITKLIMYQQSLLSTVFIKQEILIENQFSAIRINVGIIQVPDIFFTFGNARNAFQLMRLYQAKYLNGANERYFVMFKNNYRYANEALNSLNINLNKIPGSASISANATKASEELQAYYETFLKIRSASIDLRKASRNLDLYELEITKAASEIVSEIEDEYQYQNKEMQSLVLRTQFEIVVAVIFAIFLSLGLVIVVSRKITTPIFLEMQKKADELEQLAKLDGLTGIANRRLLDERLTHEWKNLKRNRDPLAVIMADVDMFKAYNDYYGHQKGDDCLIKVAHTITKCLKRPSDLAGRYGGEEFIIILPNTTASGATEVAENIKRSIFELNIEHATSNVAPHLTLSFGIASSIPCDESSPEKLILAADEALYKAKGMGRNQIAI